MNKEKVLSLLKSGIPSDFEIGLILMEEWSKQNIYDFFEEYGVRDEINVAVPRECYYCLHFGVTIGSNLHMFHSTHGILYATVSSYTVPILPNGYNFPTTNLYEERNNTEITQE